MLPDMRWDVWSYSLRGAMIFLILFLPVFWANEATQWFLLPLGLIWHTLGFPYVTQGLFYLSGGTDPYSGIGSGILFAAFFIYILLGAILGWGYGTIKHRR